MGVHLSGNYSKLYYSWWWWDKLLDMAKSNCWKPDGTNNIDSQLQINHTFRDISNDDARAIADALSVALRDAFGLSSMVGDGSGPSAATLNQSTPPAGMPFLAALEFMLFCREGGFTIFFQN